MTALDDFLEVWRVAMRLERGLIDVVFVEQDQNRVLGGPVGVVTHAFRFAGLTSGAMRRNAASTSLPRPAFTKYFAVRTTLRSSTGVIVSR